MCAKEKSDRLCHKEEITIEYVQDHVKKSLARHYTYIRKMKGFTQAEVAKRAGISRTNVSRFESGEYNPTLEMLVKLASAMDLEVSIALKERNES